MTQACKVVPNMQNSIPWLSVWAVVCIALGFSDHWKLFICSFSILLAFAMIPILYSCIPMKHRSISETDVDILEAKWRQIGSPKGVEKNPNLIQLLHYLYNIDSIASIHYTKLSKSIESLLTSLDTVYCQMTDEKDPIERNRLRVKGLHAYVAKAQDVIRLLQAYESCKQYKTVVSRMDRILNGYTSYMRYNTA